VSHTTALSPPGALRRLWDRELPHYPGTARRYYSLGLVIAMTIMMYYQYFVTAALSGHILPYFHISFLFWISMAVLGNALGAAASLLGGLADRYGRANMVTGCLFVIAGIGVFAIPHAHTGAQFMTLNIVVGIFEGIALVAAPALIRDFTPQVGRGTAMGFWAIGPVAGSLLTSLMVSSLAGSTWQDQYVICGIIGLALAAVALVTLRELSPALRDQLMVSARDRALVEARAKGIDVAASLRHPYRQVLRFDIISSTVGIGLFMIINFILIMFLPLIFETAFGFSQATANSLGNWAWAADGITLLAAGFASDKLRVRKPFMLAGAAGGAAVTTAFALHLTQPHTSYATFALLLVGVAVCIGLVFGTWMAAFTETVERRNPALVATGLSVWGLLFRIVSALTLFLGPQVVSSVTDIALHGPAVKALATGTAPGLSPAQNAAVKTIAGHPGIIIQVKTAAATYAPELATAARIDPATRAALAKDPADPAARVKAVADVAGLPAPTVARVLAADADASAGHATPAGLALLAADGKQVQHAAGQLAALAKVPAAGKQLLATWGPVLKDPQVQASLLYLKAYGPAVKNAAAAAPHQWQRFMWIAVGGQLVFIPLIFVMAGLWDPRKARRQAQQHETWLQSELAKSTAREPALA
jgi:ACS family D-galactonate transporter-like MFS transporter